MLLNVILCKWWQNAECQLSFGVHITVARTRFRLTLGYQSSPGQIKGKGRNVVQSFSDGPCEDVVFPLSLAVWCMRHTAIYRDQTFAPPEIFRSKKMPSRTSAPSVTVIAYSYTVGVWATAVIDRRLRPRCCHLGSYFKRPQSSSVRPFACNWCYCAQVIAKPKAAGVLLFSLAATSSNLAFWENVTSSIKPSEEDRATAIANMHENMV